MEPVIRPEYIEKLLQETIVFLPRIPIAIILFVVGVFLIRMILKAFTFALTRRGVEATLVGFLRSVAYALLQLLLIITVASTVGIATTSFVAMIGAAGLAVGLALQGSLSNFAGSVLLMVFKPFRVGDTIIVQGQEGIVKDMNIFNTVLTTGDNRRVVIPNGPLAGSVIINVTAESTRRVDILIGLSYTEDFEKAKEILMSIANGDQRVITRNTPPFVGVNKFGDNAIEVVFRVWVDSVDHSSTYYSLMENIKIEFNKAGIEMPSPQRTVLAAPAK